MAIARMPEAFWELAAHYLPPVCSQWPTADKALSFIWRRATAWKITGRPNYPSLGAPLGGDGLLWPLNHHTEAWEIALAACVIWCRLLHDEDTLSG